MLLCVSFGLINQHWNYFEFFFFFLVQNIFCVWAFKGKMVENLNFGKTGFKTCVFGKAFHLILMHFIHYIQCFVECFQKSGCFSLKFCFSIFSIDSICFRSIKNYFKILGEPLSVSIDRNCFSINRISWIKFF